MKKFVSIALTMCLCVGLLSGCSNSSTTDEQETGQEINEVENEVKAFEGKYVVDAEYVKSKIGDENTIIVDARGEDAASKGTVKGAIATTWQYLARCSDSKAGEEMWGTILPKDELEKNLGAIGLDKNKEIILFATAQNGWGEDGRIAWELMAAGYENVKIVNGGYDYLIESGVESGSPTTLDAVEVKIDEINETHVINTTELETNYDSFVVVDTRETKEYNGAVLYGETNGGHLPGAKNIKFTDLFNSDTTLKSNEEIQAIFDAAGLNKGDKIVTYCTGGIRSAYMQLILEMLGYENSQNYDESFYRWCAVNELE
jgi:thiosulfate/3-mercaptopyruvate sulfurtransferase